MYEFNIMINVIIYKLINSLITDAKGIGRKREEEREKDQVYFQFCKK